MPRTVPKEGGPLGGTEGFPEPKHFWTLWLQDLGSRGLGIEVSGFRLWVLEHRSGVSLLEV